MLLDLRTYTVRPGMMGAFLRLYEEHCWPVQKDHLVRCIGSYTVTDGPLNQVVFLWEFDDYADRAAKRAAMAKDPRWARYLKLAEETGFLQDQQNSLMAPTSFSPKSSAATS